MNAVMHTSLRIIVWTIAIALVALPVVAAVKGWIGTDRWPLRTLRVNTDLKYVDQRQIRQAVLPYAGKGFFAINLEEAQQTVSKLPWVERAEVRKRWPDVLIINVTEYKPFARWGKTDLLSEQGTVFPIAERKIPQGLPQFNVDAPAARTKDVIAMYNQSNAIFQPQGYQVVAVDLDRRGSWMLTLSNGLQINLGTQYMQTRLQRFAQLMPQLMQKETQTLIRADLRYTNGFALTWADAVSMVYQFNDVKHHDQNNPWEIGLINHDASPFSVTGVFV